MADRESTAGASTERKYRPVNFDQLFGLVSGIRDVPKSKDHDVQLALTALAFGCAPMPAELKACVEAEIALLEKRRVWGALKGLPAQKLEAMTRAIDRRHGQLRPRIWLTLDRGGNPTLHFLPMGDYCPELSKASRFTAFLVQAMDILIAAGLPEMTENYDEPGQTDGPTTASAIDVVNEILDLIGFQPTKRLDPTIRDPEAGELERGSRNRESLFFQYQRERRRLRAQRFPLHLSQDPSPVQGRYPTPGELRDFVSLVYPGKHGVVLVEGADVEVPWLSEIIWIPVTEPSQGSPKQDAMRPVLDP